MFEIWRINVSSGELKREPLPDKYRYLGGRGITSSLVADEVPPTCDPLGPLNKLVLAPGLLGGTTAPSSGRLSAGAKSPLTGGIKEANGGGTAGHKLARLGIRALVFEGGFPDSGLYVIKITRDGVEFLPAGDLAGQTNYAVANTLRTIHGNHVAVVSVGPAGERGYANSTIAITNMEGAPSRHMARGGLGAVLASKGVKSIVIDDSGTKPIAVANPEEFHETVVEWTRKLVAAKRVLTELGTANLVLPMNSLGCLPTHNFRYGSFTNAEKVSGQELSRLIKQRGGKQGHACQPGCPIRCSNVYVDEQGEYITSGLEYETIGLLGPNCGLSSLDDIARLDRFCDEYGIDTMELGDTLAVCMEAGLLEFGDCEGVWKLVDEIKRNTVLGRTLGQGTAITGRVLGVRRVPVVKGQGISAYDPRALKGTGVTYATSPMGADHTAGNVLPGRGGFRPETRAGADPHKAQGQVEVSKDIQIMTAVCDITGQCFFVGANEEMVEYVARLLRALYGRALGKDDVLQLGRDVVRMEVSFNRSAGLSPAHDRLPEFFHSEPLPPYGLIFDVATEELHRFWEAM